MIEHHKEEAESWPWSGELSLTRITKMSKMNWTKASSHGRNGEERNRNRNKIEKEQQR